ncbi:hypothetical protein [Nesterenkonia lutea]|uniref:hypothetical protein n=1 Tax=Nesterenkonia lutea TaxID=272919 RepID=UPI00178A6933|nr:hypothetical protein [Nesterenkonia lutea]
MALEQACLFCPAHQGVGLGPVLSAGHLQTLPPSARPRRYRHHTFRRVQGEPDEHIDAVISGIDQQSRSGSEQAGACPAAVGQTEPIQQVLDRLRRSVDDHIPVVDLLHQSQARQQTGPPDDALDPVPGERRLEAEHGVQRRQTGC